MRNIIKNAKTLALVAHLKKQETVATPKLQRPKFSPAQIAWMQSSRK